MTDAKNTKNETDLQVQRPKVTVGFERSVQVRPYETAKASIFVSGDVAGTWNEEGLFVPDTDAYNDAANLAFFEAKTSVLKQLNLPYDIHEGIVLESIDRILGTTEVVTAAPEGGTAPAPAKKAYAKGGSGASKDDLYADLLANPTKWWDNREGKRNPKAPDFKHKDTGDGIWLDKASAEVKAKYGA